MRDHRRMRAAAPTPDPAPSIECRPGCGACCIAPSISSALPGMPGGKPAGLPCPHLDGALRCTLFGRPERPAVCRTMAPSVEMCGGSSGHAMVWLERLERATRP